MDNLNLLSHAEIHSKCYFNEEQMIIASMNLYDYSEKYNREMGVLLDSNPWSGDAYRKALEEVRDIIRSAKLEKKSKRAKAMGFGSQLLRPQYHKLLMPCKVLNKHFDNKQFEVIDNGEEGEIRCNGYYENMDVVIQPEFSKEVNEELGDFQLRRVIIYFKWDDKTLAEVHEVFHSSSPENRYNGFRVFWNNGYKSKYLTIYRGDSNKVNWIELNHEQTIKKFRNGIEEVTGHLRRIERQLR